jgi:hypothetical protein
VQIRAWKSGESGAVDKIGGQDCPPYLRFAFRGVCSAGFLPAVIPAKAGIHVVCLWYWITAFAAMTKTLDSLLRREHCRQFQVQVRGTKLKKTAFYRPGILTCYSGPVGSGLCIAP